MIPCSRSGAGNAPRSARDSGCSSASERARAGCRARPNIIESKCPAKERWVKRGAPVARVEREPLEVVVVEVPVGHAHRLAAVVDASPAARPQWSSGASSVTSPPISCAFCPGPRSSRSSAICASISATRVAAVDAHAVGLARVVAGRAGEVAAREHAVRALAAGRAAAEHLGWRLDVRRQLLPAPRQRGLRSGCSGRVRISSSRRFTGRTDPTCDRVVGMPRVVTRGSGALAWLGSRSSWRQSARRRDLRPRVAARVADEPVPLLRRRPAARGARARASTR